MAERDQLLASFFGSGLSAGQACFVGVSSIEPTEAVATLGHPRNAESWLRSGLRGGG
jgi:hypothetical protein